MRKMQFIMHECISAVYNAMSGLDWEMLKKSPVIVSAFTVAFTWLLYHISQKIKRHAPDDIYDFRLYQNPDPSIEPPVTIYLKPLLHYSSQCKFLAGHALMKVFREGRQIGSKLVSCTIDYLNGTGFIRNDYDTNAPILPTSDKSAPGILKAFDCHEIILSSLQFNKSLSTCTGLWKCGKYYYGTINIIIEPGNKY